MREPDWNDATFEGNRRRQHQEFYALSLREKIKRLEEMDEVAARLRRPPARGARGVDGANAANGGEREGER